VTRTSKTASTTKPNGRPKTAGGRMPPWYLAVDRPPDMQPGTTRWTVEVLRHHASRSLICNPRASPSWTSSSACSISGPNLAPRHSLGQGELSFGSRSASAGLGAGFRGVAADISPYCTATFEPGRRAGFPSAALESSRWTAPNTIRPRIIRPGVLHGGSWVFGGHREDASLPGPAVKPGGAVVAGAAVLEEELGPSFSPGRA